MTRTEHDQKLFDDGPRFNVGDMVSFHVPGWRGKPGRIEVVPVHKIYFRERIAHIPGRWRVQVHGLEADQDEFSAA